MRTIVIGDIHGCYYELKELMDYLKTEKKYNPDSDKLVFLGDYIDRGEDSRLVIRFVRNLQENNPNVIALMGNHEDMAISYFDGDRFSSWEYNGYEHTIKSYKNHMDELKDDIEWMRGLPLYHEDDNFIYVHAGIDLYSPMEKQSRNTLLWVRDEFIYSYKEYPKRIIFGHTPQIGKPYLTFTKNICIDSGCCFGGALTALIIEDGIERNFYQVQKGDVTTMKKPIRILAQAFYGNRTATDIYPEEIDSFILGYLDGKIRDNDLIDRSIINIPESDIVIVYNKYQEERKSAIDGAKPLAIIPEKMNIYSRCIACRIDENGEFIDLKPEDTDVVEKYFVA